MTDMTAARARELLEGATTGPWIVDGPPWNRIVWSSAENRVCFMAHTNGLDDDRDIATSDLVAAAPDLARALIASEAARVQAEERLAKAVGALQPFHDAVLRLSRGHLNIDDDETIHVKGRHLNKAYDTLKEITDGTV